MIQTPIYMDYHATTPVDPRVVEAMLPYFTESFGNPASRQHKFGWIADEGVESSRRTIAGLIGAQPKEIIFTAGATEANNLALKGVIDAWRQKGNHVVTVQTEHKSVLDTCKKLEKHGIEVTYLPVDEFGLIDVDQFRNALSSQTVLASVMIANNEIGTIQPIAELGRICKEKGVFLHTDATQAVGRVPIDVEAMGIDLMSFSGHKIYGPKGIGGLYVRSANPRVRLNAELDGGGHERGMRSGTLNVPGIVGMSHAFQLAVSSMDTETARLTRMRDRMFNAISEQLEGVLLNGHPTKRLSNNLNLSFAHVEDNALMMNMKEVAVSTGSACSTADPEPSHVLKALHIHRERLHSSIRFGLGRLTTDEEIDYVINLVTESVKALRKFSVSSHKLNESVPL